MNAVIHVNSKDNLVTCLRPIAKGETITFEGKEYTATSDIPKFHKMAVAEIKKTSTATNTARSLGKP